MSRPLSISAGRPWLLGAHPRGDGFDFAVWSRHATRVWLELFLEGPESTPQVIELPPERHRRGDVWHVHVDGVGPGVGYAFRADGPFAPECGHRFDPSRRLYDPYAYALQTPWWSDDGDDAPRWNEAVCLTVDLDAASAPIAPDEQPPRRPWSELVIYETHVRGLTLHPSSGAVHPGTFLGVVEKIPYLRELGITAVELLPVHEFNPRELGRRSPEGKPLRNYWGYNPVAWRAPAEGYGTRRRPGCQVDEFCTMVRALHRAGIEVILDVVFNHSAELDECGPTFCYRGFGNAHYYLLDQDPHRYRDLTGCGNTIAAHQPMVQDLILDCLRFWALRLGVDGFRFDLASALARGPQGELLAPAPLIERIGEDPLLRDVKLIAEPWDAGGGYQVGGFPVRWSEWNDRFRDEVRRFWRGDAGLAGAFATRLCGSADLYDRGEGTPARSINFVTCHDGFTLVDLLSYADKHNLANGEGGRDGAAENFSANYGVEGPTDDPRIVARRRRQAKNFLATLFLSRGVPMLLGGDELGRTQLGNNNAYCQDNAISWYDWTLLERNADLFRFVRELIAYRQRTAILCREEFYKPGEIDWLSPKGEARNWDDPDPVLTAHLRSHRRGDPELCLLFNASDKSVAFTPPALRSPGNWHVVIDTAASSPNDIPEPARCRRLGPGQTLLLTDRSLVVLEAG